MKCISYKHRSNLPVFVLRTFFPGTNSGTRGLRAAEEAVILATVSARAAPIAPGELSTIGQDSGLSVALMRHLSSLTSTTSLPSRASLRKTTFWVKAYEVIMHSVKVYIQCEGVYTVCEGATSRKTGRTTRGRHFMFLYKLKVYKHISQVEAYLLLKISCFLTLPDHSIAQC